jgi:hypothetical protein
MFFGKGDSSKLNEDEAKLLSGLRRMVETGHIVALNADQSTLALEMIDWFTQWKSVLRLGASLRNVALLLTGLLTLWWMGQDWIVEFIQRAAGK